MTTTKVVAEAVNRAQDVMMTIAMAAKVEVEAMAETIMEVEILDETMTMDAKVEVDATTTTINLLAADVMTTTINLLEVATTAETIDEMTTIAVMMGMINSFLLAALDVHKAVAMVSMTMES